MNSPRRPFWLILAFLPFVIPLLLFAVSWVAVLLSSHATGVVVSEFVTRFWWLIFMITAFIDWLAYLLHAQHSKTIHSEDRWMWTMLLFFFAPFTNPFYYAKFIAHEERDQA